MARLEVRDATVRFGGHVALRGVDLDAEAGEVTGLIGPNGAGKTTTFDVITGLHAPVRGRILLDGRDLTRARAHERARAGIARTFQRLEVFGSLSALDNVRTAAEIRRGWSRDRRLDPTREAQHLLDRVGLAQVAHERVDALPTGLARLVELARALATRPRVLLLDEPASGLDEGETARLGELLRDLAAEGMAVLLVEHDIQLVMGVCQRVHVLDFGAVLAAGTPEEVQHDPAVLDAYLGAATPG